MGIGEWSIDTNGFKVAQHKTLLPQSMDTLFAKDERAIRSIYYQEIEELLKREANLQDGRLPKYVFALRSQKFSEDRSRGFLGSYSKQTHCDFTDVAFGDGETRGAFKVLAKRGVIESEAKNLDILFFNTWQPFMRPAYNDSLTLLDWQSVEPGDYMEITRDYVPKKDKDGRPFAYVTELAFNPEHRWVYIPNMSPEEIFIFKQADIRLDG